MLTKTRPDRLHNYIVVSMLTGARTEVAIGKNDGEIAKKSVRRRNGFPLGQLELLSYLVGHPSVPAACPMVPT